MSQPPRNFAEWMRTVERTLTEVKRNSQSSIASQINREIGKVKEEIELGTNDGRTPAAPIELVTQTYILPDFSGNMIGTIGLDFPDVVVATDATPLDVRKYEMWGRRTDDIAPEAEPRAMGLVATSEASSLTWDGVVPGATYEVAARALGVTTVRPGLMSQVVTVTVEKDLIPPPIPSALTLTQNLSVVTAAWDGLPSGLGEVMPQDFSYTEYRLRLPDGTFIEPGDQLFKAGNFYDANAPYNVAVYYSHRAVDTSGNKSGWSIESSISVTPLVDEDSIRDALQAATDRIEEVSVLINADMAELDGRLTTAEADISASNGRLATAEGTITNLTGTVLPGLESDLSSATTRLSTAEATLAPLPGKVTKAESDLVSAFGQLATVDSRISTSASATLTTAASTAQTKVDAAAALANAQIAQIIAKGQSLVRNGDFEAGLDGWPTYSGVRSISTEVSRSGVNSLKVGPHTSNTYAESEYVPSSGGRVYYLETWVRRDAGTATTQRVGFVARRLLASGTNSVLVIHPDVTIASLSTTAWTKISATYTAPATETISIRFGPFAETPPVGVYFDDIMIVDVTEAQEAVRLAQEAQADADAAHSAAGDAQGTADAALNAASHAGRNLFSLNVPSGTAPYGTIWVRTDATGKAIGSWQQTAGSAPNPVTGLGGVDGSTWTLRPIRSEMIDNLDVAKLTSSAATIDSAVINKMAVGIATVIQLNADRITAGTINAARLDVIDLSARIATVIKLNASAITAGTIDTARLNATTIAAATASIQTVDVKNLFAGAGTFQTAVIDKLWTDVITTRTINASQVNIGQGENMLPWGVLKPVGLRDVSNFMGYGGGGVRPAIQSLAGVVDGDHLYMDATWVTPGADVITWMITPGPYVNTSGTNGFVVEPGKEYMFSAYLKAGGSYGTYPGVRVSMYFYKADGGYVTARHGTTQTITWAWDKHEVAAVAPSNAAYAVIYVRQNQPGGVRMDLPGFYLKKDASLIVDGGIEARHITASESLTAKIVTALSITADKLATNAVTADKIMAGAITAGKIAANSITADRIAANAITASELATDSVLAINIKAGQVTTAKIAAGAVTTTELAAFSVTAEKMVIGTGANIIPNSQLASVDGWPGWGRNVNNGPNGQPSIWTRGQSARYSDHFPVEGGKMYHFSVDVMAELSGSRFYVQVMTIGGDTNPYAIVNQIVQSGGWKTFEGDFLMPAGATTAYLRIYPNHSNGTSTTGYQWFTNWSLTAMVDGSLIVNGSIDGKLIIGADIRTSESPASTGGLQLYSGGLRAWNPSGVQTINLSAVDGSALITGAFRSGVGTRIEIENTEIPTLPGHVASPASASMEFWVRQFGFSSASPIHMGTIDAVQSATSGARMDFRIQSTYGGGLSMDSDASVYGRTSSVSGNTTTDGAWAAFLESTRFSKRAGLKLTGSSAYFQVEDMWTITGAANVYSNSNGTLYRATSTIKNKLAVEDLSPDRDDLILGLKARTWFDRGQSEALANQVKCDSRGLDFSDENLGYLRRIPGMVAEEVEAAGLTEFVEYGIDGQVEGLMYERLGVALIPVVGRLRDRIVELENDKATMAEALAGLLSRVESLENA